MTALANASLDAFRLGAPQHVDALTVFPIFGEAPRAKFFPFSEALAAGASVGEVGDAGTVNALQLANPTTASILLFAGEEVQGARQNRIFNASALIGAETVVEVPVSCVEEGRWDDDRHDERFHTAPQVAYPTLRRELLAARSDLDGLHRHQHAVWEELAFRGESLPSTSPTGAMHDVFEARREGLDELSRAISLQDGQLGAVVMLGNECLVLDLVSRPDVWAALHGRVVQGYALEALDAMGALPVEAPHHAAAEAFFETAMAAPFLPQPVVGEGVLLDAADERCYASALMLGDELVQLSAFARGAA